MKISTQLQTLLATSVAISGGPALAQQHPGHDVHPPQHDPFHPAHHLTLTPFLCDTDGSGPADDGSAGFITVGRNLVLQLQHHTDNTDCFDPIEPGAIINGATGQVFGRIGFLVDNCPSLSVPGGGLGVDVIFSPPPFNGTQFATATCDDGNEGIVNGSIKVQLEGNDFTPKIPAGSRILKIGFSTNAGCSQAPQTYRIRNVFLNGVGVIFDTQQGTRSNCPFFPFDPASG